MTYQSQNGGHDEFLCFGHLQLMLPSIETFQDPRNLFHGHVFHNIWRMFSFRYALGCYHFSDRLMGPGKTHERADAFTDPRKDVPLSGEIQCPEHSIWMRGVSPTPIHARCAIWGQNSGCSMHHSRYAILSTSPRRPNGDRKRGKSITIKLPRIRGKLEAPQA